MGNAEMISAFADLGGTLGALAFASWLVVFLLRQHDKERQEMRAAFGRDREKNDEQRAKEREAFERERETHLRKDEENDIAMRQAMERSQEQLLSVVDANQKQLTELGQIMKDHSNDLKGILLEVKMAITTNFEKVHDHWDGNNRRSTGNERRRSSSSTSKTKAV